MPGKLAVAQVRGQIHQAAAFDLAVGRHAAGHGGDVAIAAVAFGFPRAGAFHLDGRSIQALRAVARRDLTADTLAGPPFFIENLHLQIVLRGRLQADCQIPIPAGPKPIVMGP